MRLRGYLAIAGLLLAGGVAVAVRSKATPEAQKLAEEARRTLRQQGFKTDLSQFDFSTDAQTALRAARLTNFVFPRPLILLEPCGAESAIAAWKQSRLQEEEQGYQNLPPIEQILATNQTALDSACTAVLSGEIRFPLKAMHGSAMLLAHLASLRNLSQTLAARELVDLQQNHYNAAWTNLLAATRLAMAWQPEASDISNLVRFNLVRAAWKAAWQALQARRWTEEQLVGLQREWESPDFFKGLPETVAFERACAVNTCLLERTNPAARLASLKDILESAIHSPRSALADVRNRWERAHYRTSGSYEDERDLLLFYRDRELEFRKAVSASTWQEMRQLPGVTNRIFFVSKHSSSMQSLLNNRQLTRAWQLEGHTFLGWAAQTEARRRLVIVAIALERYRLVHGSYPQDLQSLAPNLLKNVPVDFMDGNPLRYRLCGANAFVLYSVGLDCVDDGGKLPELNSSAYRFPRLDPFDALDMLWPRPASYPEAQTLRLGQARAKQEQQKALQQQAEEREQAAEQRRTNIIAELAWIYRNGQPANIPDPKIEGGFLSQVLGNKLNAGPQLRLDQMLALRQVITGNEPEMATFELSISFDALTNIGTLRLLCDADPKENSSNGAELQDCLRATNGNCLLVWNTTYDPPGKHFLQAQLSIEQSSRSPGRFSPDPQETVLTGPLFPFLSTNVLQYFPLGNVYSQKGAFFYVKLAQPVGSYSLKLTSPTGEHLHTISGSTTNGIVELSWNLIDDSGKRYTNNSFNSTWTVTFPDQPASADTNKP